MRLISLINIIIRFNEAVSFLFATNKGLINNHISINQNSEKILMSTVN